MNANNSVNELKKIRARYVEITKEELNEDTNLWHQNGITLEPLMSLTDGNIHGALIADYIAKYRDPVSIYCNECQGKNTTISFFHCKRGWAIAEPSVVCSQCHRSWCPICYTKEEIGGNTTSRSATPWPPSSHDHQLLDPPAPLIDCIVRPIIPPQPHVEWKCPQCKSNRYSQFSDLRRLNKNTAIVTLSFHNKADDVFFNTVNELHTRNPISGLMNNIGAYWYQIKDLEVKDIPTIVERVHDHYMPWETMDQLIVEIQGHTMNGLGGFADSKLVSEWSTGLCVWGE